MTPDALEALRCSVMRRYGFGTEEMKRTKVCASCGAKVSADVSLCTGCGREVPRRTLFDIYKEHHLWCRRCETVLAEDARFCPQCGSKVDPSMGAY